MSCSALPAAMTRYLRPVRLQDALDCLRRDRSRVLAGGTDVYASHPNAVLPGDWLDITGLDELRGIELQGDHWRLGGATTWRDLHEARLPPLFDGLKGAASQIGGPQVQNTGTLAGNLCNASPAADGVPPLLALDASVELASCDGARTLALNEFILGPRRTSLRPDELLSAILVPRPQFRVVSHFAKLGARQHLVISIAAVAVTLECDGNRVHAARIAVGACSPVALRLPELEAALVGRPIDAKLGSRVMAEHLAALTPIDDVRAGAAYRRHAAITLVRRALDELGGRA